MKVEGVRFGACLSRGFTVEGFDSSLDLRKNGLRVTLNLLSGSVCMKLTSFS